MKRIILLIVAGMILNFTSAQTSGKKWGIGLGVGAYDNLNNTGIGFMPELYFSRYLSPKFDLSLKNELGLFYTDLSNNLDIHNISLDLKYKFANENKKLRPYVYAGPGYLSDNSSSGLNFDLGLGGKYYINPSTAVYLEAGYINGIKASVNNESVRDNFAKITLGIEFDFGKTKDSDMDGIPDRKDKCSNTPAGVAVDAHGCPLDSDGDGVADYSDDCPAEVGLSSLKGCQDRDSDGVADKDDKCPDVPGLTNLRGCPDTDGDGVVDAEDKCPDTPKDWKVDASGCPLDQDNDGLYDEEDNCPTETGPKSNIGCPVKEQIVTEQLELQNTSLNPVYFALDKSELSETAKKTLNKIIKTLNSNTEYSINISGYTDSEGAEAYNEKLSQRRVDSVVNYLTSNGISVKRIIQQKALGEKNPIANNETPSGRSKNRRVEFVMFKR